MKVERGVITSADGVELAVNRKVGQYFLREYPQGAIASPWLGYNSLRYGRAGIERVYNEELSGTVGPAGHHQLLGQDPGSRAPGGRPQTHRQHGRAAGRRSRPWATGKGAVVALDPRTGAVLAMVSYPRYDPNQIDELWEEIISDPDRPLINRANYGLYPPGSVFKIIVAGAGLQEDAVEPDTVFVDTGSVMAGGYEVNNYGDRVYGAHTFTEAFALSINTTFAKLGVQLGADTLAAYASDFGFGETPPWRLGGAKSVFPDPATMDKAHVAQASIGQGEVLATPLQMALAAAAVANEGQIMKPYIVSQVLDYHQNVLEQTKPGVWLTPLDGGDRGSDDGPHGGGGEQRHGNRGRDRRRPGSGQDGYRGSRERRASRLVRRLRAGFRPAGGGGRVGGERRHGGLGRRPHSPGRSYRPRSVRLRPSRVRALRRRRAKSKVVFPARRTIGA